MKGFLVLIFIFTISLSSELYHEKISEPFIVKPTDIKRSQFVHPHLWYMQSLRKSNPPFHYQNIEARNDDNKNLLKYDHNMRRPENPSDSLAPFTYQSYLGGNNSRYRQKYVKYKPRKNRNNFLRALDKSAGGLFSINKINEINIHHQIHQKNSKDSKRMIDDRTVGKLKEVTITTTDIFNYTMEHWVKGKKRDVAKVEESNISFGKKLNHSLSFNLLFLLFLIFTTVASFNLVIVPAASYCWDFYRKRKGANTATEQNLEEVTVESALLNASNTKQAKETKSPKDISDKFVSNEFDGVSDTVPKEMELERWMSQDFSSQKEPRPGNHRNFNYADMELASEERSAFASSFENPVQKYSSQDESKVFKQHPDDIPVTVERYEPNKMKTGKQKSKENTSMSRNDSQPFNAPPSKLDAAYNAGPKDTRHMHSNIPGKFNYTNLVSTSEESPVSESSFENPILYNSSQDDSEESKQHQDDIPVTVERYKPNKMKTGKQKSKENTRGSRNESQPFNVPPNILFTVRRAGNGKPKIPCHKCSLSGHHTRAGKAFSSMVDVNPYRFSRL